MELKEYGLIGEQIYSGKLSNGLSVFVAPKRGFNKRYAFFAADYGGADRRFKLAGNWIDTPEGVAHFLEHEMFDMEDGDNALTILSANGASPNAFTSTDMTAYYFECVEKFPENLETLLSFVSTPYFTEESVLKEQGIIGQEIGMVEDDPDYCVYYGLMKSLFSHNPLRDSVAGTVESIAEITADTLYDCHKAFYNPSNMALCVAGDINPAQIVELANKILPSASGEVPERDYGARESLAPENKRVSAAMEVSLPIFLAGCKARHTGRGRDALRLDLVSSLALEILCGHSSPLYLRLYGEGHVNSDFAAAFESVAGAAYSMFGGECREPERVFNEVNREIAKLSQTGPDAALFGRVKKAALGRMIRALNSFDSICSNCISGHFRGYDALEAPELLTSVTEGDVVEFFRENFNPDNMAISIITPKE